MRCISHIAIGALTGQWLPISTECAVTKTDGGRIIVDAKNHARDADGAGKLPGKHESVDLLGEIGAAAAGTQGTDQKTSLDLDESHKIDRRVSAHSGENTSGAGTKGHFAGTTTSNVCKPGSALICHGTVYGSGKEKENMSHEHASGTGSEMYPLNIGIRTFPFNVTVRGETMLRPDIPVG